MTGQVWDFITTKGEGSRPRKGYHDYRPRPGIREDGAIAEITLGGRPFSLTLFVQESGIWVWRGLESFFGAKGQETAPPKVPLFLGATLVLGLGLLSFPRGARFRPAPSRPPARALSGSTRVGEARAGPRSHHRPPPAPAKRARGRCARGGGGYGRAGARGTAGARAGPGASMMEERAAAAVAAAASSCRPLGSGAGPGPTGAAPASAAAPGPGPAGKGGGGGGSPGPSAGPEPLSLPGILHFIQHEWARFEAEKARWEAERAELQVSAAPGPPTPRPARPGLTRRRRRRHLGAMAAGTAGGGGREGTATGPETERGAVRGGS